MIWVILILVLILLVVLLWDVKGNNKPTTKYLFAYRISNNIGMVLPMEFLVNWKISNLENHLYLLYLTLEEDLSIEDYLKDIWMDYLGLEDISIRVYRVEEDEDIKHWLIGRAYVNKGVVSYVEV